MRALTVVTILSLFFLALGAVAGSFAGVVAERVNTGQSWMTGRSRCNACGRDLAARDLVPIFSWVCSFGHCRTCGARVPAGYVYLEIALAVLFFLAYRSLGLTPELLPFLLALVTLAALVSYDLKHLIVPPALSAWFGVFSLAYALGTGYANLHALALPLITAGGIGLFLFLCYALSNGRLMGLGDAPVALSLALLAGGDAVSGFVYSFWIGAVVGIVMLLARPKGHRMGIEVPFVPFMAAGFLLATFTGWNLFSLIGF